MDDDGEDWDAAEAEALPELVPSRPAATGHHINKRALRNKALSVGFNDKELKDYVTGFHKRKKKRRKEAQKQIAQKDRLRRIQARKRRKLEKESSLNDGISARNEAGSGSRPEDDEREQMKSVSGIATYDTGDTTIIVTTSELAREEEAGVTHAIPRSFVAEKKQILPCKTKPFKRVATKKLSKKKPKHGLRKGKKDRKK